MCGRVHQEDPEKLKATVTQAAKDRTVTGTFWQETQPVSGAVTTNKGDTGYTKVHKDVQTATSQSFATLWDPTAGKKFVITDIIISVDTAMTVMLSDVTTLIFQFFFAANGGCVINLQTPYESTAADNILKYTNTVAGNISITVEGYEV